MTAYSCLSKKNSKKNIGVLIILVVLLVVFVYIKQLPMPSDSNSQKTEQTQKNEITENTTDEIPVAEIDIFFKSRFGISFDEYNKKWNEESGWSLTKNDNYVSKPTTIEINENKFNFYNIGINSIGERIDVLYEEVLKCGLKPGLSKSEFLDTNIDSEKYVFNALSYPGGSVNYVSDNNKILQAVFITSSVCIYDDKVQDEYIGELEKIQSILSDPEYIFKDDLQPDLLIEFYPDINLVFISENNKVFGVVILSKTQDIELFNSVGLMIRYSSGNSALNYH